MRIGSWSKRSLATASLLSLACAGTALAADVTDPSDMTKATDSNADVAAQIKAMKAQIAELEAKENDNWLTDERTKQIRGIVEDVLKDAKTRGQFADGDNVGYKDGFYLQTSDGNYKLVINGFIQARYEYSYHHDPNSDDALHPISATSNREDTSGFDIRRARLKFTGNVVSPNIIYGMYADFFGNGTGNFTVLEAYAGYNFTSWLKVRAGALQVPFAKDSADSDAKMVLMSRPEEFTAMMGIDTPRAMGVSILGEIIANKWNYEVQVNNGFGTNTFRRPDTTGTAANLDNRLGFYGKMAFVGSGSLKDFTDEPDMRTDNRDFVWQLWAGAGYESQNAATGSLPSPQTVTVIGGISNGAGPGFKTYALNGDVFRGTLDWSAKYQGWSVDLAGLFQQINANPGTALPLGVTDSSFFQDGYYAQIAYMVIPQKLELAGRLGYVLTEGLPNIGEYYTLGANYYIAGHNAVIQSDVTYTPESAFTDASENQLQNTHTLSFRVQFQVLF